MDVSGGAWGGGRTQEMHGGWGSVGFVKACSDGALDEKEVSFSFVW